MAMPTKLNEILKMPLHMVYAFSYSKVFDEKNNDVEMTVADNNESTGEG